MMASLLQILVIFVYMSSFFSCSAEISSRRELRSEETNQANLVHSTRIDPSRVVQLSWQPRVFVYRGLISEEECDHLIALAQGQKEGINSVVSDTQGLSARSSATLDEKDEVVARIEEKLSAWTLLPLAMPRGRPVGSKNGCGSKSRAIGKPTRVRLTLTKKEQKEVEAFTTKLQWSMFMRECIHQLGPHRTGLLITDSGHSPIVNDYFMEEWDNYTLQTFSWEDIQPNLKGKRIVNVPEVDDRIIRREPVDEDPEKIRAGTQKVVDFIDLTVD